MDDTIKKPNLIRHWNNGPNQAWLEAKTWNIVKEEGSCDFELGEVIVGVNMLYDLPYGIITLKIETK